MMSPIAELNRLYGECTWGSLGQLILWNAMYHLECRDIDPFNHGHPFNTRIPQFDKVWAVTREPYRD